MLALAIALGAPSAGAVGLGEVISQSSIGRALRVEIQLPGARPERADGCIRVLLQKGKSADGIPGVASAQVAVRRTGSGAVAVITDPAPIHHPILRLRLQEICDSNLEREYVLLLSDPPEVTPPAQALSPAVDAPSARPSPDRIPRPPRGYIRWTARGGESLASLAARRHPNDPAAQARFIARAEQANPGKFGPSAASASTRLPPGTQLAIPRKRLVETARAPAQARSAAADRVETPAPRPTASATPSPKADQLVVQGREPAADESLKIARDIASSPGGSLLSEEERDLMRREQKLQTTVNDQIALQAEVAQRLRKLEALQAELRAQVTQIPDATPATAPHAAPSLAPEAPLTRPPRPETSSWPAVLALLAGAGIAMGLWTRRRRGLPLPPTPAAGQKTAPSAASPAAPTPEVPPPPDPESVALAWDAFPPTSLQPNVAPTMGDEELLAEHDSVIELAEIMLSFGRVHGAAETLAEFIRAHPRKSVAPWVKLLQVYRTADMQPEFEALSQRMNQTFNVVSITWDNFEEALYRTPTRLEDLPHLMEPILRLWGSEEGLEFLDKLLRDNREGTRRGFAIGVADDLLMLMGVLDHQLRVRRAALSRSE